MYFTTQINNYTHFLRLPKTFSPYHVCLCESERRYTSPPNLHKQNECLKGKKFQILQGRLLWIINPPPHTAHLSQWARQGLKPGIDRWEGRREGGGGAAFSGQASWRVVPCAPVAPSAAPGCGPCRGVIPSERREAGQPLEWGSLCGLAGGQGTWWDQMCLESKPASQRLSY